MSKQQGHAPLPGLRSFITGAPRTKTPPTAGSRTQRRKAAFRTYSAAERVNGRAAKD